MESLEMSGCSRSQCSINLPRCPVCVTNFIDISTGICGECIDRKDNVCFYGAHLSENLIKTTDGLICTDCLVESSDNLLGGGHYDNRVKRVLNEVDCKKCSRRFSPLPKSWEYCSNCSDYCKNCGTKVTSDNVYCSYCESLIRDKKCVECEVKVEVINMDFECLNCEAARLANPISVKTCTIPKCENRIGPSDFHCDSCMVQREQLILDGEINWD